MATFKKNLAVNKESASKALQADHHISHGGNRKKQILQLPQIKYEQDRGKHVLVTLSRY